MRQSPERGFCRALVDGMMDLAKDGLDEKKNDYKDANYRVAVVYLSIGVSLKRLMEEVYSGLIENEPCVPVFEQ